MEYTVDEVIHSIEKYYNIIIATKYTEIVRSLIEGHSCDRVAKDNGCSNRDVYRILDAITNNTFKRTGSRIGKTLLHPLQIRKCTKCNKLLSYSDYSKDSQDLYRLASSCRVCRAHNYNKEQASNYNKNYYRLNIDKFYAKRIKRLNIENNSTIDPFDEIPNIYINCPSNMVVDHIIPLINDNVCGLNTPANLQYLTGRENSSKSNKFDFTYDNNSWRKYYTADVPDKKRLNKIIISPELTAKEIAIEVASSNWSAAARKFGLSDNGLRKRFVSLTGKSWKVYKDYL